MTDLTMHPDLTTSYLGLTLKNPLVASASPLSKKADRARRLEDAGIAAVVMYSLFEEQIVHESLSLDHYLSRATDSFSEALTYLPDIGTYSIGPDKYLEHLFNLKRSLGVPVIGSLNGISVGGWVEYAHMIEQAGADALELNIYNLPIHPDITSAQIEDEYVHLVQAVRARLQIPFAVKLSPYFTALPNLARRLAEAGANGLVLFNRFYQPDFDLDTLTVEPNLVLSTSGNLRLPLRWIAILYGRIPVDFALTSGIHTAQDVLKAMMAGANVAMMTSHLLEHGTGSVSEILHGIEAWMLEHEYESITQMRGSMSQLACAEPAAFERANYMRVLSSYDNRLPY